MASTLFSVRGIHLVMRILAWRHASGDVCVDDKWSPRRGSGAKFSAPRRLHVRTLLESPLRRGAHGIPVPGRLQVLPDRRYIRDITFHSREYTVSKREFMLLILMVIFFASWSPAAHFYSWWPSTLATTWKYADVIANSSCQDAGEMYISPLDEVVIAKGTRQL